MHKAGGLGVSGERKPRKVKERCFKKLLSTSDWMGSTFLHFLKATFFFFPTESLPVVWLPSIYLYSYNSRVRKEHYFHISNSLNASMFAASTAGSECFVFTHLNAHLEALSGGVSRLEPFCHAYGQVGGVVLCGSHPSPSINVTTTCGEPANGQSVTQA